MKKVKKGIFSKLMLHELHNDLPLLPERMDITKVEKPVANLQEKNEYLIHIRNLKQALNHGLVLRKVQRVVRFNQKAWIKSYIQMNTELRKKAKNDFEKEFFKLMKNSFFGKTIKNKKQHAEIKLIKTCRQQIIIAQSFPQKICSQ